MKTKTGTKGKSSYLHPSAVDVTAPRKRGRPPKTEPLVSGLPKLTVYMEPTLKTQLHVTAALQGRPAWQVVCEAVANYIQQLPKADRDALNALAERFQQTVTRNNP